MIVRASGVRGGCSLCPCPHERALGSSGISSKASARRPGKPPRTRTRGGISRPPSASVSMPSTARMTTTTMTKPSPGGTAAAQTQRRTGAHAPRFAASSAAAASSASCRRMRCAAGVRRTEGETNTTRDHRAEAPGAAGSREPQDGAVAHLDENDWRFPSYLQSQSRHGAERRRPRRRGGAAAQDWPEESFNDFCDALDEDHGTVYTEDQADLDPACNYSEKDVPYLFEPDTGKDLVWLELRAEAKIDVEDEPILSSVMYSSILSHRSFEQSLAFVLAHRLRSNTLLATRLIEIFEDVLNNHPEVRIAARADLVAARVRDPACLRYSQALLYYKGYLAIQSQRIAHTLWESGQRVLALTLQSRMSEVYAVDIHPAARIGKGILLDHGTGCVIGATAVIKDRVSICQGVTLGGTGKVDGDRHPKVGEGVLIGACATVLGNIRISKGVKIGAGSLVLKPVPPYALVAGSPARIVGYDYTYGGGSGLNSVEEVKPPKPEVQQSFCEMLDEAVKAADNSAAAANGAARSSGSRGGAAERPSPLWQPPQVVGKLGNGAETGSVLVDIFGMRRAVDDSKTLPLAKPTEASSVLRSLFGASWGELAEETDGAIEGPLHQDTTADPGVTTAVEEPAADKTEGGPPRPPRRLPDEGVNFDI